MGFFITLLIWIVFVYIPYQIWGVKVALPMFTIILTLSFVLNAYYGMVKRKLKGSLSEKLGFYMPSSQTFTRGKGYKETGERAYQLGKNNLIIGIIVLIILLAINISYFLGYIH